MLKSEVSVAVQLLKQYSQNEVSKSLIADIQAHMKEVSQDIQAQIAIKRAEQDKLYTQLGQNRESAMDWNEIAKTIQIYNKLKRVYEEKFKTKGGTEKIIEEYIDYLVTATQEPLSKSDKVKRQYNDKDPEDIRVYKSALRALLDDAPGSRFGSCLHPDAQPIYALGNQLSARDILSFFILAAMDDNMALTPELEDNRAQCVVEEILNLTSNIADIRRAHNAIGDMRSADDTVDEPSCFPGVIGRIGNMHLHNPASGTDDLISPSEHFKRKTQAFFINEFQELTASDQFNIINGIYYQIYMFEKDEDNRTLDNFIKSILTEESLQRFIKELEFEFGLLDEDHLKMAVLTYLKEILQSNIQIEQSLLHRLEEIANDNLVEAVKVSIEDELANEHEVLESMVQFRDLFGHFDAVREDLAAFKKDKPTDFKELSSMEEKWEVMKDNFVTLLKKQEATAKVIRDSANGKLSASLKKFEDIYERNRGAHIDILSDKKRGKVEFYPFWYLKIRLKFEDVESKCEHEALHISKFLKNSRIELLLKEFDKFILKNKLASTKEIATNAPAALVEDLLWKFNAELVTQNIKPISVEIKESIRRLLLDPAAIDKAHISLPPSLASIRDKIAMQQHIQGKEAALNPIQRRKLQLIALEKHRLGKMPNLMGEFEVQKAQHYMMTQADTVERLGLKDYLAPGVVVKIERVNTDPAVVSFTTPFDSKEVSKKKCKISIATLRDYANHDKRLRAELAHEADILLRRFSDLSAITGPDASSFSYLFLDQLSKHKQSDPMFYQLVLQNQSENDLNTLLDILDTYPEDHQYKNMIETIETSLSFLSNDSEFIKPNVTQRLLEEEIQKIYIRKKKVSLGSMML